MEDWLIWSLVLFGAGLLITALEVIIPSGGLLGLAALACLVGSLACAYQLSGLTAVILAVVEVICVPAVVIIGFKILPKTSLGRQLILSPPGETDPDDPQPDGDQAGTDDKPDDMLGREGVVRTALRPSGTAEFDGRRISVVSAGEAVPEGRRVRVVLVEGIRLVVEEIKA
ncbi:MAG: NfeD family protein [Dehalococcoidia bacterium]